MLNNKLNNINVVLILLSISLIVPKWIFSYYLFPNEDLLFKILSETRSIAYYPLVNNLSDFNLSRFMIQTLRISEEFLDFLS